MVVTPGAVLAISLVSFATAILGVVTGGNSLVLVPAMLALGLNPRVAVATNMMVVTFLALSGWIRFARHEPIRWDLTRPLVIITLVTSWVGARLVGLLSDGAVHGLVVGSVLAMLVIILVQPRFGEHAARDISRRQLVVGLVVSALLGIYGGLFSGGYTTLMTFVSVGLLGASLREAVGLTKVVNFASSAIASIEFARQGIIDYRVGIPASLVTIAGAWIGASYASRMSPRVLRLIFTTVLVLLTFRLVAWDWLFGRG
jgi:hypothetical protein